MEAEILLEIKEAEKKADEITERAKRDKEAILQETGKNSSKLLAEKQEEIRKAQEKRLIDFREKAKLVREEKSAEGKASAKQLRTRAEKNIAKAVEFIIKKFEEAV